MRKYMLKKIWIIAMIGFFSFIILPYKANWADDMDVEWFNIMPELTDEQIQTVDEKIGDIWSEPWRIWTKYNKEAEELSTKEQVASWIMNWDTIMNYLVFLVQFLSQLWLVVWTIFIIYAWYKYITSAFMGWKWADSKIIIRAITWILIIIFSYAIMRILTSFIWLT